MTTNLHRHGADREDWLGSTTGFGIGGLIGIVAALLVAEHRAAGHENFLDAFGLWWSVVALGTLGASVAMQPLIVDRWASADDSKSTGNASATPD